MRIINIKSLTIVTNMGLLSLLMTACSGGGGGGNGPLPPPKVVTCITNPDPTTALPSQAATSPDEVWHDYTFNSNSAYKIYGYNNPNQNHVKKITIFNNYSGLVYPVVYSPTPFTGSDGQTKTMSRIFVGSPSCSDRSSFYLGIPSNGKAEVYVPKQMWDAGHVKVFTEPPPMLQQDVGVAIEKPLFTIDRNKNSPNLGHLLYASGTANDFPLELPFQLTEYTFEARCHDDNPNCATVESDLLTVDFDISAVDQLFLPVTMEETTGSRGYVGTGMTVTDFQKQIFNFTRGNESDLSYDAALGWPFYYGSAQAQGYKNNLIKIPMGFNTINSILKPSPSPFDPNHLINSIWVFNKNINQAVGDQPTLQGVLTNMTNRWTTFWNNPAFCAPRSDKTFCDSFNTSLKFLNNNIVNACKAALAGQALDPALCLTAGDARSVATDSEKVRAIVGYTFIAKTFSEAGGPYPAVDADNICTTQDGSNPPKDATFYSDCFRDAAKSVQRGVPYPFWLYPSQFYPDISSVYNLNPVVWLVHKKLDLSEYAFSVDDDIGNQELVGNGFTLTVGGLNGLVSTNAFHPSNAQLIAFPNGTSGPWQGTVSGSSVCLAGTVASCDLNIQNGGYQSVDVTLTGIPGRTNADYFLNFTITTDGPPLACPVAGQPNYQPLKIINCSTTSGLKNCEAGRIPISFSAPGKSCAQTVAPQIPNLN